MYINAVGAGSSSAMSGGKVKPVFTYAMPCPLLGCVWREYYCDTHQCYQPFYRFSRAHIEAGVRECIVCEEAKGGGGGNDGGWEAAESSVEKVLG